MKTFIASNIIATLIGEMEITSCLSKHSDDIDKFLLESKDLFEVVEVQAMYQLMSEGYIITTIIYKAKYSDKDNS